MINKKTSKTSHSNAKKKTGGMILGYILIAIAIFSILFGIMLISSSDSSDGLSINSSDGCVGVIKIDGPISATESPNTILSQGVMGSEEISKIIDDADKNNDVKSILLVINSPGGSPVGSREIYHALKRAHKPIVAYFREVAASGGYYVAMGADYIVSEPDAITGSIGAKMTMVELSSLFNKIGYNETAIKSGELKDIGSPSRPMTEKEREILQNMVDEIFNEFRDIVELNRGSKLDRTGFEKVLDARIMTGRQAYKIGLVDEVGSKKDAIKKASELAGEKEEMRLCELDTEKKSFFEQLFESIIVPIFPRESNANVKLTY